MTKNVPLIFFAILIASFLFISGCAQGPSTQPASQVPSAPAQNATQEPQATILPPDELEAQIQQNSVTGENKTLLYENKHAGIRFRYPSSWEKQEAALGFSTVVITNSANKNDSDGFKENLNVIISPLPFGASMNNSTTSTIELLNKTFTDFNLLESNPAVLAGVPAHKLVYTIRQGQYNLRTMQVYAIKNNKLYTLTTVSGADDYASSFGTMERMIQSFEILDTLVYENPTYGIKLEYPSSWTEVQMGGSAGLVAAFQSPQENESDVFVENIVVAVSPEEETDLGNFTNTSLGQLSKFVTDFNLEKSEPATLGGAPARMIAYTGKQGQLSHRGKSIWALVGGKAYILTYGAEYGNYQRFLPAVDEIISSFEILPLELLTYENRDYGIRMKYPKNWEVEEEDTGISFSTDRALVRVTIGDLINPALSLDEQMNNIVKTGTRELFITNMSAIDETTLSGYPARKAAYTIKIDGDKYKKLLVFSVINGRGYFIEYTAYPKWFPYFEDTALKMTDSIEII